jgi:hypothetical protein
MEPDGSRNIDAITAGKMSEENLSPTREQPGSQQDQDMLPSARVLGSAQEISPRAAPQGMLHQLQQLRQHSCGKACADASEDHRQPEECCSGTRQGRGYHGVSASLPKSMSFSFSISLTGQRQKSSTSTITSTIEE